MTSKKAMPPINNPVSQRSEVNREDLCRTARQLQDEIAKCLTFMRESRACVERGRLPMFADTHQNWCLAEEALHTVWVKLHYDSIPSGVGRTDLRTAWGVLEASELAPRPKD